MVPRKIYILAGLAVAAIFLYLAWNTAEKPIGVSPGAISVPNASGRNITEITIGGPRTDIVEPPPIGEECKSLLESYNSSPDFRNRNFSYCWLVEGKVGFGAGECPSGYSPNGCSLCRIRCEVA